MKKWDRHLADHFFSRDSWPDDSEPVPFCHSLSAGSIHDRRDQLASGGVGQSAPGARPEQTGRAAVGVGGSGAVEFQRAVRQVADLRRLENLLIPGVKKSKQTRADFVPMGCAPCWGSQRPASSQSNHAVHAHSRVSRLFHRSRLAFRPQQDDPLFESRACRILQEVTPKACKPAARGRQAGESTTWL